MYIFELIPGVWKQDPDPFLKILFGRIRIRAKMDRIRHPVVNRKVLVPYNYPLIFILS